MDESEQNNPGNQDNPNGLQNDLDSPQTNPTNPNDWNNDPQNIWGDPESVRSGFSEKPRRPLSYFETLKVLLSEHKMYFIGMAVFFFVSVAFWYVLALTMAESHPEFLEAILESFADIEEQTAFELFVMIFLNNAFVVCLLVLLGFCFGLVPVFIIFINGASFGFIMEYILRTQGLLFFLAGIVPHGIIEIPTFILAGAVGFRFGVRLILALFMKVSFADLKKDFLNSLWLLFFFMIPMLLVAAFIESYITSYLLGLVG